MRRMLFGMARPSKGGSQVNTRLPDEAIVELDEWVEELRAGGAIGTSAVTRSDIIRDVVLKALKERREATPKKKGRLPQGGGV